MMFARVRITLTLVLVVIFVLLYAATSTSVYALMRTETLREINTEIKMQANAILPVARRILLQENGLHTISILQTFDHLQTQGKFYFSLRNAQGMLLATNQPMVAKYLWQPSISKRTHKNWRTVHLTFHHLVVRMVTIPIYHPHTLQYAGELQLGEHMNGELAAIHRLQSILLEVGLLGLIGAMIAGFYVSGVALRPIRRSWQRQQQFVADASHELRTPLAVIQSNLDVVLGHAKESVEDNFEWLNHVKSESRRLSRLVTDLLTLAKADSNQQLIQMNPIDWIAVNRRAFESLMLFGEAKGLRMNFHIIDKSTTSTSVETNANDESTFIVVGDEDRLYQLAFILLDNAITYTYEGEINVQLRMGKNHHVILDVTDTGIGIKKEHQKHIFDRFFKGDHNRTSSGAGLGLAIALWIVESHHGKMEVESTVGKGTTFRIILPASSKAHA